jgi:polyphosphate kinase 2 (PPK2 family)
VALTFKEVRRVCQVPSSGKVRSSDYDPSWAANKDFKLPEHGRIGIFNRSYYEDVLVVRVHPELRVPCQTGITRTSSGRTATTTSTGSSAT